MEHPETRGGRLLKRGDTFDIECHRTTYRLQLGQGILAHMGVKLTWEHSENTGTIGTGLLMRTGHVCDYRCKAMWPEWASGEMFDLAYRLASEVQDKRGGWHRNEASKAKYEREKAARA